MTIQAVAAGGCNSGDIFASSGQTWTYGSKPKVSRCRLFVAIHGKPWVVLNHQLGPASFATWREAMDYALFRPVLMNVVN